MSVAPFAIMAGFGILLILVFFKRRKKEEVEN
jgi:LPXTG-motif cell wall anchor domain protein